MVQHDSIVDCISDALQDYQFTKDDVTILTISISFDPHTLQVGTGFALSLHSADLYCRLPVLAVHLDLPAPVLCFLCEWQPGEPIGVLCACTHLQFFMPLCVGGKMVLPKPDGQTDAEHLTELVRRTGVTTYINVKYVVGLRTGRLAPAGCLID